LTIATTSRYNPTVDKIVEDAFDLAGIPGGLRTSYDLQKAIWMLNDILLDWHNEHIPMWLLDEQTITMVSGTKSYDVAANTMEIRTAFYRQTQGSTQFDYPMERVTLETYADISTKEQTGRPNLFYFEKSEILDVTASDRAATVTLWPVPDSADTFVYTRERKIADVNEGEYDTAMGSLTLEIPQRFIPALKRCLAVEIGSVSEDPVVLQRAQAMYPIAMQMKDRAFGADKEQASIRLVPRHYHI